MAINTPKIIVANLPFSIAVYFFFPHQEVLNPKVWPRLCNMPRRGTAVDGRAINNYAHFGAPVLLQAAARLGLWAPGAFQALEQRQPETKTQRHSSRIPIVNPYISDARPYFLIRAGGPPKG